MTSSPAEQSDESATARPSPPGPVLRWIIDHDDRWTFIIIYVGLAVGLSLAIGLFWLLAVVALHFVLECITKWYFGCHGALRIGTWAVWDMKFDIALSIAAIVLVVYTNVTFGVAGASSLGRGALLGMRFSRLSAVGRVSPIPLRDAALSARFAMTRKVDRSEKAKKFSGHGEQRDAARAERLCNVPYPWQESWSWFDRIALALIGVKITALLVAPLLVEESPAEILSILREQLHPLP